MAKHKNLPVEKNKEYELYIESVTSEGMGVAHIDGFCIFVAGTVTGDRILALIVKIKSGYAYGKFISVIEKSKYRVDPICPVFSKCGGCQLMHIDYGFQLEIKREIIKNALLRIGGFDIEIDEMIGADNELRYRNKMIFPVGNDKNNNPVCGFFRERSHDIIPLDDCALGSKVNAKITAAFVNFIKKNKISVYDEKEHKGIVRRIFIREAAKTDELMVVVSVNAESLPRSDELVKSILEASDNVKSIILNINTKRTNLVLGDRNKLLYGEEYIEEYLCGMKFKISPYSFFQINPEQTKKLYDKAIELADISHDDRVLDIYCGIGTISLAAARKAGHVIGVEIVEQAVTDARKNADINKITNAEFFAADAADIVPKLVENGERPNVVVLDPPRKGSDENTLRAILKANPERIVYISCNPATLARDLKFLCSKNYEVK
ncbi:MAG: 23S rRNA (uracil(1939)-C(5))-methyltransferase RlmD, partial [Clostridia bacterium]|nr:23S rRNA (uracil(1939)-C(5))-methyltransferase RlmD [Clostridia bacterium]